MVKDAEAHVEEDRKFRELVDIRNQGDNLIHATEKSMGELGDKFQGDEKSRIEKTIGDLKAAMKDDDKMAIEARIKDLTEASAKMAERLYTQQAEEPGREENKTGEEGVVDAEFEEVKEDKK
jgi:molecular chaperone DnaK